MIRFFAFVLLALGIAAPAFAYEDFERHQQAALIWQERSFFPRIPLR